MPRGDGCLGDPAGTVSKLTPRPVLVAPEPVEGVRGVAAGDRRAPPAARHSDGSRAASGFRWIIWRVRLLWFGYPANLPPLLALVPALERYAARYPLLLTCVTHPTAEIDAADDAAANHRAEPRLRVHFVPWSPIVMDTLVEHSDVVADPERLPQPRQAGEESQPPGQRRCMAAGFVIAHPLPAYAPYSAFAWIGEDLIEGLDWAIRHPREVRRAHRARAGFHRRQAFARGGRALLARRVRHEELGFAPWGTSISGCS